MKNNNKVVKLMINYTHVMSEYFVGIVGRKKNYSREEKIVITYGVELLFNTLLKSIIYILLGILLHQTLETVISILIFGILRYYTGGVHAKTDIGCFLLTGGIVFAAVFVPYIWNIPMWTYWTVAIIMCCIYKYFLGMKKAVVADVFLIVGAIMNDYWRTCVLLIIVMQGITIFIGGFVNEKGI